MYVIILAFSTSSYEFSVEENTEIRMPLKELLSATALEPNFL